MSIEAFLAVGLGFLAFAVEGDRDSKRDKELLNSLREAAKPAMRTWLCELHSRDGLVGLREFCDYRPPNVIETVLGYPTQGLLPKGPPPPYEPVPTRRYRMIRRLAPTLYEYHEE